MKRSLSFPASVLPMIQWDGFGDSVVAYAIKSSSTCFLFINLSIMAFYTYIADLIRMDWAYTTLQLSSLALKTLLRWYGRSSASIGCSWLEAICTWLLELSVYHGLTISQMSFPDNARGKLVPRSSQIGPKNLSPPAHFTQNKVGHWRQQDLSSSTSFRLFKQLIGHHKRLAINPDFPQDSLAHGTLSKLYTRSMIGCPGMPCPIVIQWGR